MSPTLLEGKIVVGIRLRRPPKTGDIVILRHNGLEKIKRVTAVEFDKVYLEGDNILHSTDSRHFGWLHNRDILGTIIWPRSRRKPPANR
jgi:signal peptidase I